MVTLSKLQCQKLERLFRALSSNGGKSLIASDFSGVAHRLAALRGVDILLPPYTHMLELQLAWWDKLRRSAGVEYQGEVNFEQWLVFWTQWLGAIAAEAGRDHQLAYNSLKESGESTFDMIDTNADGWVSASEYFEWCQAMRVTGNLDAAFNYMDTDHDGFVRREDCVALVMDFYLSRDPASAGNFLLGGVEEKFVL